MTFVPNFQMETSRPIQSCREMDHGGPLVAWQPHGNKIPSGSTEALQSHKASLPAVCC